MTWAAKTILSGGDKDGVWTLATLHNTAATHRHFELWKPDHRYVGHLPLPADMMPDAVSFIVNFPDGTSDSCSARQIAVGTVHDCMETDCRERGA